MALTPARERDPNDPYFQRVFTVANAITLVRFALLVPVCWLVVTGADGSWVPVILLAVWASTDWIDGVLARALHQESRLGEVLDPIADRIGIIGVTLSLAIAGVVDWWILAVIFGMDVLAVVFAGREARDGSIHVSWLGKIRTALLLVAIVVLLLAHTVLPWTMPIGVMLMLLGTGLHIIAAIDYMLKARRLRLVQTGPTTASDGAASDAASTRPGETR